MNSKTILSSFLIAVILTVSPFILYGDDHIVREQVTTYRGHTSPKQEIEVWIGENKSYYKGRRIAIIFRADLGIKWTLSAHDKKYFEKPLETTGSPGHPAKRKERIQEIGWHYDPVFDWEVKELKENREFEGKECRIIFAEGDADFAEKVCELWVTRDVPIDIKRYNKLVLKYSFGSEYSGLFRKLPEMENFFILKSKMTTENAIAPTRVVEVKVVKMEKADPPPGLYNIPPGYSKVNSIEKLRGK